ncbi:hypothetical protein O181_021005 [Austropuccinia psidii MF-1]|uniref:Uncharacterized protein n=1 Tax=Austropuccinia psidii MF-1 TaxID=1389203 RepID=A0A9Q3CEW1_9BASI|nr:hypothetical protein [Austropuccinia psidii MF-1]
MNSYLTVRKLLGHPNTCKLLNGWHPLMENKNMMALTAEWRKKKPYAIKESAKTSPSGQKQKFQPEKSSHKLKTRAEGSHQPQSLTARATGYQRISTMPWKMCFRWPEE